LIFRGTFEHALDAKHRLTVPARYREVLTGRLVISISPEAESGAPRSVGLWLPEDYERWMGATMGVSNALMGPRRSLQRALYNNSWEVETDAAHRVMIPAKAMDYAGLQKEVTVTGSGDCLEIWDRAAHAAYNEDILARFTEIAESIDHTA
jgi:MraZ protein